MNLTKWLVCTNHNKIEFTNMNIIDLNFKHDLPIKQVVIGEDDVRSEGACMVIATGSDAIAEAGDGGIAVSGLKGLSVTGVGGYAISGHSGVIRIHYIDGEGKRAYTTSWLSGEGLKANTLYKLNEDAEFVEVIIENEND